MTDNPETKVVLNQRILHGSHQPEFLQRVATVYINGEEYRVSAPPEAKGDALDWAPHFTVRQLVDLSSEVEIHDAFGDPMAMLIVDIDHFKDVNDNNGHVTGDDVLRQVADALIKVFLRKNDFVARVGGDEFAVILRETSAADAHALAERVLGRIRCLRVANAKDDPIDITVSIGLAPIAGEDDGSTWLERADRGLYAAKNSGRDRVASASSTG